MTNEVGEFAEEAEVAPCSEYPPPSRRRLSDGDGSRATTARHV
jgi:hypothetical protein